MYEDTCECGGNLEWVDFGEVSVDGSTLKTQSKCDNCNGTCEELWTLNERHFISEKGDC